VKTFLESSATKVVMGVLVAHLLVALVPMLDAHAIDWWALGKVAAVDLGALLLNAMRADVTTGIAALDWRNPK
jgi:hypothetical protein